MPVKYEEIMSDLRKRSLKPVYFLAGDEPYYIDLVTDYIAEKILSPEEKAFNQVVIYGEDSNINSIMETSRRFPMMASHQVVIVKEAQSLKNIEDLLIYVEKPLVSTVLVICYKYKTLDKRTKLFKALDSIGSYFESAKLRDYQIPPWIESYLMSKGIRIDTDAAVMLTEYLGTDLNKITNELDKLFLTMPTDKPRVTTELIEKNIGISKDFNNFELQKAIGYKNIYKANMIVNYFSENQKSNPLFLTIASLLSLFTRILLYHYTNNKSRESVAAALKIMPVFARDYEAWSRQYSIPKTRQVISLLRTYDLKAKGYGDVSTDQGELLKELVYKILH